MAPTLLVIDLQQGLVDGDPSWGPRSTPELTHNVSRVLGFWRKQAWLVIHVHHDDADPANPLHHNHPATFSAHPCATPLAGEPIFYKGVGSAFVSSKLEEELHQREVKELCVIGMEGTKCITGNTRHACDLGFEVTVVADACASYGMQDYRDFGKHIGAEETHHACMGLLANDEARVVMTGKLLESLGSDDFCVERESK